MTLILYDKVEYEMSFITWTFFPCITCTELTTIGLHWIGSYFSVFQLTLLPSKVK